MERYLSAKEVMSTLNIGRSTVYALLKRQDFPASRVGKKSSSPRQLCASGWRGVEPNSGKHDDLRACPAGSHRRECGPVVWLAVRAQRAGGLSVA
ncbi:MAG: helix-turn-helix domain-containing protein [Oscillospiraceae bacterium]|nr:helix-turn-helix domain-containing protein [Oscillospiraceae bacterium]